MVIKNGSYFSAQKNTKLYKKFIEIDARDKSIGRIASIVAKQLIGKDDHLFNSSSKAMIHVLVKNAKAAKLTGKKEQTVVYRRHSGRPGGEKILSFMQVKEKNPKRIFERAIKGMLPKNRYGRKLIFNLQISFE